VIICDNIVVLVDLLGSGGSFFFVWYAPWAV